MADHPVAAAYAGVLLFVIGLGIGGGTLEMHRRQTERMAGWAHAGGTVVDVVHGRPLIAFSLPSGDRVSFTAVAAPQREYSISESVPVLYRPDNPTDAAIDPLSARLLRNSIAAGASMVLMALGAYVAWYARRRWEAQL